jgi:hypothetical protein
MITPQQPLPVQSPQTNGYGERQFLHTLLVGVVLPLVQSAGTGLIVCIVSLIVAFMADAMDLFSWPILLGVLTFAGMWLFLLGRWIKQTDIEMLLGRDLNNDHVIGKPAAPRLVKVQISHIKEDGHYQVDLIDLPATDEQLFALATGLLRGISFADREWTPQSAGRPFSVNEFRDLRSVMLKRGLLDLKNRKAPQQGYGLTEAGRALMEELAEGYSPTSDVIGS